MRLSRLISLSILALSLGACGDSEPAGDSNSDGDGGASATGGATSTGAATSSGGAVNTGASGGNSTTTTTTTTTTGAGGATGTPCTPPQEGADTTPTEGVCQGNTAVTCGEDGYLKQTTCTAAESCVTYELGEYVYDSSGELGWVASRTFDWAGCVPDAAEPCSLEFNGNYYGWGDDTPHCDGDSQTYCSPPALPEYNLFGSQVQVGTTLGYFKHSPCGANETCYEPLQWEPSNVSDLMCLPKDAASCTTSGSACEGDTHVQCLGEYGVEVDTNCAAQGNSCFEGCANTMTAFCKPPSTEVCDPQTHPLQCTSAVSYNTCNNCLKESQDCSTVFLIDWNTGTGMNVPGQCAVTNGAPTCVLASATICDQNTTDGWCDGDVAKNCMGIVTEYDCGAVGQACGVANGVAGCKLSTALACEDGLFGGSCNGSILTTCCSEGGQNWLTNVPCVPGFDTNADCATRIPGGYCIDNGIFAECQTDAF